MSEFAGFVMFVFFIYVLWSLNVIRDRLKRMELESEGLKENYGDKLWKMNSEIAQLKDDKHWTLS